MAATDTALCSMNNDLATRAEPRHPGRETARCRRPISTRSPLSSNQLAESVKTSGNTEFGGNYIFSGTATSTEPFTLGGADTYNGNSSGDLMTIGQGVNMQVNVTGDTVVSPILAAIRQAVTDLQTGGTPANLGTTDLQAIQAAASNLAQTQAVVGAGENRLTQLPAASSSFRTRRRSSSRACRTRTSPRR